LPTLLHNGAKIFSDQEKIDAIAQKFSESHLLTVNQTSTADINRKVTEKIAEIQGGQPAEVHGSDFTSPNEIKSIIKRLGSRKAPGPDGINNIVVKNLPRKAVVYLTYIFNACIRKQYFPKIWRWATVVAIAKPGKDPADPKNYRPISLLCTISKIFERVILIRILRHIDQDNVLPDFQFGFRPHHSTCHQIVRITNHVKNEFRNKVSTGMLLLDIEKAFDTVWHDGLIYKMCAKNFPLFLVKLTQSFLTDRTFCVHYRGLESAIHQIPAGLPQGATLSPTLYGVFTCDPPELPNCDLAVFADDTAIYTSHSDVSIVIQCLQNAVNLLQLYYSSWKIKINPSKSQCIYFSKRRSPRYLPSTDLDVCGSTVPWSDSVKYLGVFLDKKLLFANHIEYVLLKTEKMFRIFYSILNRRSRMNTKNKLVLYKVALRSILIYCCPAWANCALTHKKKIQIMQNKYLKTIFNLPWYSSTRSVHELAEIDLISELVVSLSEKFENGCHFSENPLINSLYE
jgi:hypothetical protein